MRGDDVRCALAISRPGRIGVDHESADAARAGGFAGAREHAVEIGDAAVGDPGLLAVEHVFVAFAARAVVMAATSEPAFGLGQSEGGDRLARGHAGQIAALLVLAAGDRDRPRAQSLHGEREVGQPVVARRASRAGCTASASRSARAPRHRRRARSISASRHAPDRAPAHGRRRRRRCRGRRGTGALRPRRRHRARACDARPRRTAIPDSSCQTWCPLARRSSRGVTSPPRPRRKSAGR